MSPTSVINIDVTARCREICYFSESDLSEDVSDIDEAEYEKFVAQKQADRAQRGMRRAQNGDDNFSDSDNSDYWKEKPGALPKVNDVGD